MFACPVKVGRVTCKITTTRKIFTVFAALHKRNFKGLEQEVKRFLLRRNKKAKLFCNCAFIAARSRHRDG